MFQKILKVAGVGLTTILTLAVSANNARALDFTFPDLVVGSNTINGTFRINDAIIPSDGSSAVVSQSNFLDWKINFSGTTNTTLFGDGSGFGTDNSDIVSAFFPTNNSIVASNSELTFGNPGAGERFCITGGTPCTSSNESPLLAYTNNAIFSGNNQSTPLAPWTIPASAASATPVPFEPDSSLGIFILGSLYGFSRLRKTLATHKSK